MPIRSGIAKAATIISRSRNLALAIVSFGVFFIVLDALLLPAESIVGRVLKQQTRRAGRYDCPRAWFTQPAGEVQLCSIRPPDDADIFAYVWCGHLPRSLGFWAITREKYDATLVITADDPLPIQTENRMRSLFSDYLATLPEVRAEYVQWVRVGATRMDRVVWSGYVHNFLIAGVALLVVFTCVAWMKRCCLALRAWARQAAGHCPSCGYDLRGNPGSGCSECGWRRAATPAA